MDRKKILLYGVILFVVVMVLGIVKVIIGINEEISTMNGTIIDINENEITLQGKDDTIYTFNNNDIEAKIGDNIAISFTGLFNESVVKQDGKIVEYVTNEIETNNYGVPLEWLDKGIFSQYYILANDKLKDMSLEEKIGQLILGQYSSSSAFDDLEKYKLSGFVFYEKDFKDKTEDEVKNMFKELQSKTKIPLLTAVDEEGGSIVRVSSNSNLREEKFKSPRDLYDIGGYNEIKQDTIEKSIFLKNLGINLNLAPVVDIVSDTSSYIYKRTIGLDAEGTAKYASTVIEASLNTGVSYSMKHFPGYGDAEDSHEGKTYVKDTYEVINNKYLVPFRAGINSGAEAVLMNHNIYTNIDSSNPASISPTIHNILRNELKFTGIIITDDLTMSAAEDIENIYVYSLKSGNNLLITADYDIAFDEIKKAVTNGEISENTINKLTFKILAWKYYKGLMFENQK